MKVRKLKYECDRNCYCVTFSAYGNDGIRNINGLVYAYIRMTKELRGINSMQNLINIVKTKLPAGVKFLKLFYIKKCNEVKQKVPFNDVIYKYTLWKETVFFNKAR